MSEVTDLLQQLAAGEITVDAVAADFEARTWPTGPSDAQRNADAMSFADPEPIAAGSFDEVATAYVIGEITAAQYATLAQAAAKAMG